MLTCYRLRDRIYGEALVTFEQALDLDDLGPRQVLRLDPVERPDFTAQLFVVTAPAHEIDWQAFLRGGWPGLQLPYTSSAGAVLFVRIRRGDQASVLAFTFGTGRYLLRHGAWEPGFGIRTALNIIYAGGVEQDPSRLRALDAKRVALNTVRTRYQANRSISLEIFDVDVMRDILSGITGNPSDRSAWGTRVDGRDSVTVHSAVGFEELGQLCHRIVDAADQVTYRQGFGWIDNVRFVQDESMVDRLVEAVLGQLRAMDVSNVELGIPEVIDWARVAGFRYSFDRDFTRPELNLSHYLQHQHAKGKLEGLDLSKLKRDRVIALGDAGQELHHWNVWQCLDGQTELEGSTYVLDGGDFYEVEPEYLRSLDAFLDGIGRGRHQFPAAEPAERESAYLERVASSDGWLLLDQQLVHLEARTTPVEICDLFATDGTLVHAKKGRGSTELSHLFSQGLVSAELLVTSPDFRNRARDVVARVVDKSAPDRVPWLDLIDPDRFSATQHDITFVVIRPRRQDRLSQNLPFFSKVNLRRCLSELRRMGYSSFCEVVEETVRNRRMRA